jgi:hypothetical protein
MSTDRVTPDRPPCFVCEKREAEPGQILCGVCIEWAETGCRTPLKGGVECGEGGVCVGCFARRRAVASTGWVKVASAAEQHEAEEELTERENDVRFELVRAEKAEAERDALLAAQAGTTAVRIVAAKDVRKGDRFWNGREWERLLGDPEPWVQYAMIGDNDRNLVRMELEKASGKTVSFDENESFLLLTAVRHPETSTPTKEDQ